MLKIISTSCSHNPDGLATFKSLTELKNPLPLSPNSELPMPEISALKTVKEAKARQRWERMAARGAEAEAFPALLLIPSPTLNTGFWKDLVTRQQFWIPEDLDFPRN